MNLYEYAVSNPVNFTDPSGLLIPMDESSSNVPGPKFCPLGGNNPWQNFLDDLIGDPYYWGAALEGWLEDGFWIDPILGIVPPIIKNGIGLYKEIADKYNFLFQGGEIVFKNKKTGMTDLRIAPFGNKKIKGQPNPWFRKIFHFHRRKYDPKTGEVLPGQGIGQHRPWQGGW